MNNFEKYNTLHNEVMKRLEDGEITIECAKEINDLAFEKYIIESPQQVLIQLATKCLNKSIKKFGHSHDLTKQARRLYDEAMYANSPAEQKSVKPKLDDLMQKIDSTEFSKNNTNNEDIDKKLSSLAAYIESIGKRAYGMLGKNHQLSKKVDGLEAELQTLKSKKSELTSNSLLAFENKCKQLATTVLKATDGKSN